MLRPYVWCIASRFRSILHGMERIALLHNRLQLTITIVLLVITCWGLVNFFRNGAVGRLYASMLTIAGLLLLAEGLLGLALLFGSRQPARLVLHLVYGTLAVLALPLAYLMSRARSERTRLMIFSLTSLFLVGIVIRAYETGL
jgi:hypothetical protein